MSFFQLAKTVIKSVLRGPSTLMYPAKPAKKWKNTRGRVENDISKCIFCGSCQRKCPCVAICVDPKARTWEIDRYRCIACGSCVEACPVKSLRMENDYSKPSTEPEMKTLLKGAPKPEKKPEKKG